MAHFNAQDFGYVKNFIENDYSEKLGVKFIVLSNEYVNNRTPLDVIDENGYMYSMSYGMAYSGYNMNAKPRVFYKHNKYTIENIKHYIEVNQINCTLLSTEFYGNDDKLNFQCACGNKFSTTWSEFYNNNKIQCNSCGRKRTIKIMSYDDSFVKEYLEKFGLKLLSDYKGSKEDILIGCKCGNSFSSSYINIYANKYKCCSECAIKEKHESTKHKRYEKIRVFIKNDGRQLLTLEDNFLNSHSKIDILCRCGNKYTISASQYDKQCQCLECAEKIRANKRRMSTDEINDIIKQYSDSIGINMSWYSGEHKNNKSYITLIDDEGYKYYTKVSHINARKTAILGKFSQSNPYTIDNIKIWMQTEAIGYELLSDIYVSAKDYLLFRCPDGHEFRMTWDNFKQGQRCPECQLSKGARMVLYHLRTLGLNFDIEYYFKNCRGNRKPLPFDFVIFDKDGQVEWLCEFDGELHYEPPRYSHDEEKNLKNFKRTQRYDKIKTEYCANNNIPLLRIPYWERDNGNIEKVIDDFIFSLSLKKSA